jgi:GNAT superfamily N-acetyltransferase
MGSESLSPCEEERTRTGGSTGRGRIREAVEADVPEILGMIVDLAEFEKEPDAVKLTESGLRDALFGPRSTIFAHVAEAAEAGGTSFRLDGFALWYLTFSTWEGVNGIHLEDLYVRPACRGTGRGRALLQSLAAVAVARGWRRVEWQVLNWNSAAIEFYRSLGAHPMSGWSTFRLDGGALEAFGGAASSADS